MPEQKSTDDFQFVVSGGDRNENGVKDLTCELYLNFPPPFQPGLRRFFSVTEDVNLSELPDAVRVVSNMAAAVVATRNAAAIPMVASVVGAAAAGASAMVAAATKAITGAK